MSKNLLGNSWFPFFKCLKVNIGLGGRRSKLLQQNEILPSIILKIFSFQIFKTLDTTCSRLHQRLQNSFKVTAISSWQNLKSIGKGNLYVGPLHMIDRILESVMIFNPLNYMTRGLIAVLRVATISRVRNRIFNIKFCYYVICYSQKTVLRIGLLYL